MHRRTACAVFYCTVLSALFLLSAPAHAEGSDSLGVGSGVACSTGTDCVGNGALFCSPLDICALDSEDCVEGDGICQGLNGAGADGSSGAEGGLTRLFLDIESDTERFVYTGPGTIEVREPAPRGFLGTLIGVFDSGVTLSPTAGVTGAYQLVLRAREDCDVGLICEATYDCLSECNNYIGNRDGSNQTSGVTRFYAWDVTAFDGDPATGNPISGRLWSDFWQFDAGQFWQERATNASFYALVPGGAPDTDAVIELDFEGLAGFVYQIFGFPLGVVGADGVSRGLSVPLDFTVFSLPNVLPFPIYLNPPDIADYNHVFPCEDPDNCGPDELIFVADFAYNGGVGDVECNGVLSGETGGDFTFTTEVEGTAQIICDLNGDGEFNVVDVPDENGVLDLLLIDAISPGNVSISWNGLDSLGRVVAPNTYDCRVRVTVGELHYIGLDMETGDPGLRLFEVTLSGDTTTQQGLPMFWNDYLVERVLDENGEPTGALRTVALLSEVEVGAIQPGPDGLDSGDPSAPFDPLTVAEEDTGNSRAWGNFTGAGRGNVTFLDTFTWVADDVSDIITVIVFDPDLHSDADRIPDFVEECVFGTDPFDEDSDDDNVDDGVETAEGSVGIDTDGDGTINALDDDDDGDGVLSVDEDVDGDDALCTNEIDTGPCDDFTDGDDLPNYLDPDSDGDGDCDGDVAFPGICTAGDNCWLTPNEDQANLDEDALGDVCDPDIDGDDILNDDDNCVRTPNNDQSDLDEDTVGDVCDPDLDGDGIDNVDEVDTEDNDPDTDEDGFCDGPNSVDVAAFDACVGGDNCPIVFNDGQENTYGEDNVGDACDDTDSDGVNDDIDNCPLTPNGPDLGDNNQADLDDDDIGDSCDSDIDDDGIDNDDETETLPDDPDTDDDGFCDGADSVSVIDECVGGDNCPVVFNDGQENTYGEDNVGDACDDTDADGVVDASDNCPLTPNGPDLGDNNQADLDDDDIGDSCDADIDDDGIDNDDEDVTQPDDPDSDDDGFCDGADDVSVIDPCTGGDNCPATTNPGQENNYGDDDQGDACDDSDADGVFDATDNCPLTPNGPDLGDNDQVDSDGDSLGDSCDDDRDGDGVDNGDEAATDPDDPDSDDDGFCDGPLSATQIDACTGGDNCPSDPNADQANNYGDDTEGDVCDDTDADGVVDATDNCPIVANGPDLGPNNQADADGDGIGDSCDGDRDGDGIDNGDETATSPDDPDSDDDGFCDGSLSATLIDACTGGDNCPIDPNADQADNYGGAAGDVCDDTDSDGVFDASDNCPVVANGPDLGDNNQVDSDGDGIGDSCDDDRDGDGIDNDDEADTDPDDPDTDDDGFCDGPLSATLIDACTASDNCPVDPNEDQANNYGDDSEGDVCDDSDDDTVVDATDNCPETENEDQADNYGGPPGDVCDDTDDDTVLDVDDNCPVDANTDQEDLDEDDIGDVCDDDIDGDGVANDDDNCVLIPNTGQDDQDDDDIGDICDDDRDGDTIVNDDDNCPDVANTDQLDRDENNVGDVCDEDGDTDGIPTAIDNCPTVANSDQADADDDGVGDLCDTCVDVANADTQDADLDDDGTVDACDDDRDGDGLTNTYEDALGTDPDDPDTDDGGVPDGEEVEQGINPLDGVDDQGFSASGGQFFGCSTAPGPSGAWNLLWIGLGLIAGLRRRRR